MGFRAIGIVAASLALALVVAAVAHSGATAESAVGDPNYATLHGLNEYEPPVPAYFDTPVNRARLIATAIAEPARYSGFTEMTFEALTESELFDTQNQIDSVAVLKEDALFPVSLSDCDENCRRRIFNAFNAVLKDDPDSGFQNWYKFHDQGQVKMLVYCHPESSWSACSRD